MSANFEGLILDNILPVQVNVTAKSSFDSKLFALNVVISVPMPDNTAKAEIQTTQGDCPPLHHWPLADLVHEAAGT